jgi:hypothetical protein
LVLALVAAAAFAAPVALADTWGADASSGANGIVIVRPDDRGGIRGGGVDFAAPARDLRPDDRTGIRGVSSSSLSGAISSSSVKAEVVRIGGGFDWGDASVGAAVVFAGLLLAGGVVVLSRRHRQPATS